MKFFKLGLIAVSSLLAAATLVAPAKATDWPANYEAWSSCAGESSIFCIIDEKSDSDGNETNDWMELPSSVKVEAYFYNLGFNGTTLPSFSFRLLKDGRQELDPALPSGSKVHLKFNLGPWNPRADFSNATNKILDWDTEKVGDNWVLTIDLQTEPFSFATECWPWSDPWTDENTGESGDFCTNPRNRVDYQSYAQVAVGSDATNPNHPDTSPSAGVWVANNATGGTNPWLDQINKTFEMDYAGPPTKIDGTPNFIFAQAFIPDHTLSGLYGVDPTTIDLNSSFQVTRKDGDTTSVVNATIQHTNGNIPGILINIPEIVTYVAAPASPFRARKVKADAANTSKTVPKIQIKIRAKSGSAPGKSAIKKIRANGKFAILTLNVGSLATDVQATCAKGKLTKTGITMLATGMSTVKLSKGTWNCKVRSVRTANKKRTYSAWSTSKSVKIK